MAASAERVRKRGGRLFTLQGSPLFTVVLAVGYLHPLAAFMPLPPGTQLTSGGIYTRELAPLIPGCMGFRYCRAYRAV